MGDCEGHDDRLCFGLESARDLRYTGCSHPIFYRGQGVLPRTSFGLTATAPGMRRQPRLGTVSQLAIDRRDEVLRAKQIAVWEAAPVK